jgi:hypothetical protein
MKKAVRGSPGKPVRVRHVVQALEQSRVANDRMLALFQALDQNMVLAMSGGPKPAQPSRRGRPIARSVREGGTGTGGGGGGGVWIEPLPLLKENCS